jgi:hypothetical protein
MKNIKHIKKSILAAILWGTIGLSSCDYLDVVPDNTPTIDHAFANRNEAENYLFGIYGFLPTFDDGSVNPSFLGGDEIWYLDPVTGIDPRLWYIARGAQGTNAPLADYWASVQNNNNYSLNGGKPLFTAIRDCNIFLENIDKPFDLTEAEQNQWIAEIKFLKAYFHFWLFRMYGPIPLIKENLPINASPEEVQTYREPVDDVVDYIVELLDESAAGLDSIVMNPVRDMGRATKPMALAVKAQVLTLAASPLFNGTASKSPSFSLVDNREMELFPQTYDAEKWKKASEALKEAIIAAKNAGHDLFEFNMTTASVNTTTLSADTYQSMQVRGAVTDRWNREIIWGDPKSTQANLQGSCFPRMFAAHTDWTYRGTWAPPLRMIEQFYTKNGLPIEEDNDWAGVNLYSLKMATDVDKLITQPGYEAPMLHFDREARFYGSILFDRGRYFGNGRLTDNTLLYPQLKYGTPGAGTPEMHSSTGYLCKKLIHCMSSVPDISATSTFYRYAFPIIRLADLYLMYAEALNECKSAPDADVYEYIDLVRKRTGLDGVVQSYADHAVAEKKNKPLTQEGMREIIRRERLNELAFEGIRFWDLRRWMLSEEYMNRPILGLNINGTTERDFYVVNELYPLKFEKKDYFWPIRQSVLTTNKNLKQNIGW